MPSYQTPAVSPDWTSTQPYARVCAVPADPLAGQAGRYGNAFMQQQVPADPSRAGEQWARDPALLPFYEMLNDPDVAPANRAAAMLRYRNQKLARTSWGALTALVAGEGPVSLDAETAGTHHPLFTRLGQDPAMQQLVGDLAERALAMPADAVDIAALWEGTRGSAADLADPEHGDQASLLALQAMATFMNAQKFDKSDKFPADPQTGLPATMPEGVTPELWATLVAANRHVRYSPSPNAAVMSLGVPAWSGSTDVPYTADNNFHFWTHAWLSAELQRSHGLSAEEAEAFSAVAGAHYELQPGSFREEHGNAGMKDILVNAEGAAFGSELVADPSAPLPGQDQGPPYDLRALGRLPSPDAETEAVLERADIRTLEGLLDALLDGVLRNDEER